MYFLLGKVICVAFLVNTYDRLVSYAGEVVNSSLAIVMETGVIFRILFSQYILQLTLQKFYDFTVLIQP